MPESHEGYARLPEDLLHDLLQETSRTVERVEALLLPAVERREALRRALTELGLIQRVNEVAPRTICGVDGGFAVERTAAVDMMLSVAVGVEGLSEATTIWESTQYEWWSRADRHDLDNERLCRGVMIGQELSILSASPHEVRILDGSHLTLVIQLNSALSSFSEVVQTEARRVWERLGTPDALHDICRNRTVVAMPKFDSSTAVTTMLEDHLGEEVPGDDKHLLTMLLNPGEYVSPLRVPSEPWTSLHFNDVAKGSSLGAGLMEAIEPLKDRQLLFTYYKPDESAPAFRLEIKPNGERGYLDAVCSTIAGQMTGPFVREPYPQYLADVMAKSVGLGLSSLQAAVQLSLSQMGRPELSELLIHAYRTEGV